MGKKMKTLIYCFIYLFCYISFGPKQFKAAYKDACISYEIKSNINFIIASRPYG